jgi:HEAT repeat protein
MDEALPGFRLLAEYSQHIRDGKRVREPWDRVHAGLIELGASAMPALRHAVSEAGYFEVQLVAVRVLAELGAQGIDVQDALLEALDTPRARVRREAIVALIRIGGDASRAVPVLLERLVQDRDEKVRCLSARALGVIGSSQPAVVETLVCALEDPSPLVRGAAAESLGKVARRDESIGQLLEEHFLTESDRWVRPGMARALARTAPARLVQIAKCEPALFGSNWLGSLRPQHRLAGKWRDELIMHLATLGTDAVPIRELFVHMLSTPARLPALYALARIGAAARDCIPAIASQLDKPAREALRAISFASWHEEARLASDLKMRCQSLRMRLQRGEVSPERVELAARLGDLASTQALQWPAPSEDSDALDAQTFKEWCSSFEQQPLDVRVRLGQAVARDVLPLWQEEYLDHNEPRDLLHALEDWLVAPSEKLLNRLEKRSNFFISQWSTPPSFSAGWTICHAAELARGAGSCRQALLTALTAWEASSDTALGWVFGPDPWSSRTPLKKEEAIRHLRQVIRTWVVPWVLGEGDPLSEPLTRLGT